MAAIFLLNLLLEGLQVTLEETMIFRPAFTARLAAPDAPLPSMEELLGINISASQPFVKDVQAGGYSGCEDGGGGVAVQSIGGAGSFCSPQVAVAFK